MKRNIFLLLLPLFIAATSFAQNSILAGKILDEKNNPVAGAIIKMQTVAGGGDYEAVSDGDGLYCSPVVPAGAYKITVTTGKKFYRADQLSLRSMEKLDRYYDFKLKENKAEVSAHSDDPFMKAKLGRIQKQKHRFDYPADGYRLNEGIPQQTFYRAGHKEEENKHKGAR
jgi:hypothetical protein